MTSRRTRVVAITVVACLAGQASILSAQGVEVAPFGGYRFGGDFFEIITGQPVDLGRRAVARGRAGCAALQRLSARRLVHPSARSRPGSGEFLPSDESGGCRWTIGRAEACRNLDSGRLRPFLTGTLGLTRYAAEADSELRFTARRRRRREDVSHASPRPAPGQPRLCDVCRCGRHCHGVFGWLVFPRPPRRVVWQAEFTAGVVVKFR